VSLDGRCIVAEETAVSGRCQEFGNSSRAGKQKIWETEKLTVCTPDQLARIPDFQVFRCSPAPSSTVPRLGRGNSERQTPWLCCRSLDTERIVNAVFMIGECRPNSEVYRQSKMAPEEASLMQRGFIF